MPIPDRERDYTDSTGKQFDHMRYWKDQPGGPPPPTDPAYWCAVHRRPLTWRESQYAGAGPRCAWCRDPMTAPVSDLEA